MGRQRTRCMGARTCNENAHRFSISPPRLLNLAIIYTPLKFHICIAYLTLWLVYNFSPIIEFPCCPKLLFLDVDKFYLVDTAYKMVPGFLALFKGGRNVRVGQGRGRSQVPKELFNTRHSQLRNIIERFFSVLKQRFAYLRGPVPYSYMQMQINFVITCCALHNFLRENQPSDDHFMMYEQDDVLFEGEGGAPPYPQIQPLTSLQQIEEWKGMREEMANEMHAASRRWRH